MTCIHIPGEHRESDVSRLCELLLICFPGKPIKVEVEEDKPKRSQEQLGAMFGLAYKTIMQETGLQGDQDKKKLHRDFCGEYFGWRVRDVMGRKWKEPVRTTTTDENGRRVAFTKTEQAEFYSFVERISAECGIQIPAPDPRWRLAC